MLLAVRSEAMHDRCSLLKFLASMVHEPGLAERICFIAQPRLPPQVARELRAARRQSVTLRRNVERSYRKDLFMTNVRRDQAAVAVFATYALRKLNYDASVCFNRRCEAQTRSAFVNVSGKGGDKWCCERCPRGVWITPPLPAVALPSEPDIWFGDEGPLCPACTAKVDLAAAED